MGLERFPGYPTFRRLRVGRRPVNSTYTSNGLPRTMSGNWTSRGTGWTDSYPHTSKGPCARLETSSVGRICCGSTLNLFRGGDPSVSGMVPNWSPGSHPKSRVNWVGGGPRKLVTCVTCWKRLSGRTETEGPPVGSGVFTRFSHLESTFDLLRGVETGVGAGVGGEGSHIILSFFCLSLT